MTTTRIAVTAALVTALGFASPALAQDKRDEKARESARAAEAGAQKAQKAEPRRSDEGRRNDEARRGESRPRSEPYRSADSVRNEKQNDARRLEKKEETARELGYGRSYYGGRDRYSHYDYRVYGGRTYYRPYTFRPHLSIAFGIFAGYPVPYSYRYDYPIAVYGYRAPRGPVYVGAGSSLYGGVALEIAPYDADVFVDGSFAGKVQDFDGTYQPLTLAYGTHRIEVQAPGLVPLVFDVTVQPGQVIPYRGELRPY